MMMMRIRFFSFLAVLLMMTIEIDALSLVPSKYCDVSLTPTANKHTMTFRDVHHGQDIAQISSKASTKQQHSFATTPASKSSIRKNKLALQAVLIGMTALRRPLAAHAVTSSTSASSILTRGCHTLGLAANGFVMVVPIWVFFLQAPCLFKLMGRDKFLQPMMKLTELLFRWTLPIAAVISLVTSVVVDFGVSTTGISSVSKAAGIALAATLVNALVIVPRALKAGRSATKPSDKSTTVTDFAVSGGSKTNTKKLHQSVVVMVVVAVIASILRLHWTTTQLLM